MISANHSPQSYNHPYIIYIQQCFWLHDDQDGLTLNHFAVDISRSLKLKSNSIPWTPNNDQQQHK